MKINIQKIAVMGASFLAVLSIVLSSVLFALAPRCYAVDFEPTVVTVNAMDHIEDIVIDGDVKTVYFRFLDIKYRVNTWSEPSGTKSFVFGKATGAPYFLTLPDGTTSFVSRVYLFGSEAYEKQSAPVGVLDVSDIMPGASLELTIGYDMTLAATLSGSVKYTQGAYLYDADGGYVDVVYVAENEMNLSVDGKFNQKFDLPGTLILPHDVSYVLPFTSISFACEDGSDLGGVSVTFVPYTLEMSVDINMIYENSQTMDAIKDAIGDLNNNIQDTNDKLDDTNNKLDNVVQGIQDTAGKIEELITGGVTGDDAQEDYDKLAQGSQAIQDAMDNHNKVEEKLPKPPASVKDIVSDDTDKAVDEALDNAAQLFDWESSGLSNMYVPMGLSVSLSTLFYIIFGKKG